MCGENKRSTDFAIEARRCFNVGVECNNYALLSQVPIPRFWN